MSIVAGVDFGTLSVRVSIVDHLKGRLASGVADYPLLRKREDPDWATQRHQDHMDTLVLATQLAIDAPGADGHTIEATALDTRGASLGPVGEALTPLAD